MENSTASLRAAYISYKLRMISAHCAQRKKYGVRIDHIVPVHNLVIQMKQGNTAKCTVNVLHVHLVINVSFFFMFGSNRAFS